MKRFAILLCLTACTCCTPSLAQLEREISVIQFSYVAAERVEETVCKNRWRCDDVRAAHYTAAAELTNAKADPTRASIDAARAAVGAYAALEERRW